MRTGIAQLPLHGGKAPKWLFDRMVRLSRAVVANVVEHYGPTEMLRRLSDPFWFQAFGCVLGFDWHSSGVTTTTCAAVKEGIRGMEKELGFFAAGGKGKHARQTPNELEEAGMRYGVDAQTLIRASRLSAKVDSACVQDGFQLYHHAFFFTQDGHWCVVQQGMDERSQMARRYHWLSLSLPGFDREPHAAVCCDRRSPALNLVAAESEDARRNITLLAGSPTKELDRLVSDLPSLQLPKRHRLSLSDIDPRRLHKVLLATYEAAPKDFVQLLGVRGLGPKSLRALALAAELIYGSRASFRDPARFAFAHGGKDGTPFPVDRQTYDRTIKVLQQALEGSRMERSEKAASLKRLMIFAEKGYKAQ